MNIVGKKVLLRAIEEEDLPMLHIWANDPEIQQVLGGWHFPTNKQDQRKWFESLSCQSKDQRFAIEVEGIGLVGTSSITGIDWKNKNAFFGLMIGNISNRGTGIALDACLATTRYVFNELGLNRFESDLTEANQRSFMFMTKHCDWKLEGRRPEWFFRDGRWHDKLLLGITRQQFLESEINQAYWRD